MLPFLTALTLAASVSAGELDIAHEQYELDNGLDVILAHDDSTPIVYVSVWYHVGSKDEREGLSGFAHLFEHLMFNGSLSFSDDYFAALAPTGARINGTTNFDRTNYFETLPSQHLPRALFLESDRMGYLLDVLDQAKLDEQRAVVKNERRQRYENPPYGEARKTLYENLYPVGHPYHHMTIGVFEDLNAASLDDVRDFFNAWYGPSNASLVVAGDFDTEETKAMIEEYFGGIDAGQPITRPDVPDVTLTQDLVIRQFEAVPEQKVWLAWHAPKLFADGDAELDLLSSVIASGKDSRLYKELVMNRKVARSINVYQASTYLQSAFTMTATAAKGHTTDEVVAAFDEVMAEVLGDQPPTTDEVDAARAGFESSFYRGLATINGKGERLQTYNMHTGSPDYIAQDVARYTDLQPDDLVRVGKQVTDGHRVVLHIWPEADRPETEDAQ